MTTEIWKPIQGYKGLYEISTFGKIKSFPRNGTIKEPKILKPCIVHGYPQIKLCKNNRYIWAKIHRLVAIAFIPNPENKPDINHKNSIRNDSRIDNLEWCTPKENFEHAYLNKKVNPTGEGNFHSKLKEKEVIEIRKTYESKTLNQKQLAKKFKVSQPQISAIILKKQWKHITEDSKEYSLSSTHSQGQ